MLSLSKLLHAYNQQDTIRVGETAKEKEQKKEIEATKTERKGKRKRNKYHKDKSKLINIH